MDEFDAFLTVLSESLDIDPDTIRQRLEENEINTIEDFDAAVDAILDEAQPAQD